MRFFKSFIFLIFILIIFSVLSVSCGRKSIRLTDIPEFQKINVEINATNLNVFDAASQVIIENGFSITTTNERIGLISTDYTPVKWTLGRSFALSLFGMEDMEIMLNTNIKSLETGCILTIIPKARVKKTTKDLKQIIKKQILQKIY